MRPNAHASRMCWAAEDKGYLGKMATNPKTGELIYAASVVHDTNIDLLTLAKH